jgi:hypothetical protein
MQGINPLAGGTQFRCRAVCCVSHKKACLSPGGCAGGGGQLEVFLVEQPRYNYWTQPLWGRPATTEVAPGLWTGCSPVLAGTLDGEGGVFALPQNSVMLYSDQLTRVVGAQGRREIAAPTPGRTPFKQATIPVHFLREDATWRVWVGVGWLALGVGEGRERKERGGEPSREDARQTVGNDQRETRANHLPPRSQGEPSTKRQQPIALHPLSLITTNYLRRRNI